MPEWIIQLLISGGVPLVIVGAGYAANRRLGISTGQKTLVETLQSNVAALQERDAIREREFKACKLRLEHVEADNADLKQEVFELRTDLTKAMARRARTTRTRKTDDA